MNPNKLKRLFPHASKAFQQLNSDNYHDPRSTYKPKLLAEELVEKTQPSEALGATHSLVACDIEFFAEHGQKFDRDNKDNLRKCIWDALVNLSFSRSDKDFKGKVRQRMDSTSAHL